MRQNEAGIRPLRPNVAVEAERGHGGGDKAVEVETRPKRPC